MRLVVTIMKDIFTKRAQNSFFETLQYFLESLASHFSDCPGVTEWNGWFAAIQSDEQKQKCVQGWIQALDEPLKKKSAKYARAVKSITANQALVYHAIMYHDVTAMTTSSEYFSKLNLASKIQSLTNENVTILWQYMEELSNCAYASVRRMPPLVPSTNEISADISKRKGTTSSDTPGLKTGLHEMWHKLCEMRDAPHNSIAPDVIASQLNDLSLKKIDNSSMNELCNNQDSRAFTKIIEVFPFLNGPSSFNAEEWSIFEKCMSLSTMHSNIPLPMMQGIEDVANKLVADIKSGKTDLSSLNVEAIGQQVLSGVSQADMNEFARNIDKILPAMQNM
jgi:hypothetical protein